MKAKKICYCIEINVDLSELGILDMIKGSKDSEIWKIELKNFHLY